MKRILSVISVIIPLILSACSKEPPSLNTDLSAGFAVTQNDITYEGEISLSESGMSIIMTQPYTVSSIGFRYDSDGLRITCAGHQTAANCDYIPPSAIPQALHNALTYLPQAAYRSTEDGADRFTLPTPYGEADVTAQDGVITSLYEPNSGLEFTFSQKI